MPNLTARLFVVCGTLLTGLAQAAPAAEILIVDAKSQPESLTVAPGGILFVSSANFHFVYSVRPGSNIVERFGDAGTEGEGTFFFGMLADAATITLWACQSTPVGDRKPVQRHTALRGFDLAPAPKSFVGTCRATTVLATISQSDRTRCFTSPTLPTAKSTSYRRVLPRPNFSRKTACSAASTRSPFWMARCM